MGAYCALRFLVLLAAALALLAGLELPPVALRLEPGVVTLSMRSSFLPKGFSPRETRIFLS